MTLLLFAALAFAWASWRWLAPTPTTRQIPTGFKMPDGYQSLITFSSYPALNIWECDVSGLSFKGGEAINTTTMLNQHWRTFDHAHLKEVPPLKIKCAFDPNVLPTIIALINTPQTLTIRYPDLATFCFYGFLMDAEQEEFKEKTFPQFNLTIVCTNWDSFNQVEQGPVFTPGTGTDAY